MKKIILGLDLGTNSIGWALVDNEKQNILGLGSRIIPMTQDVLGKFDSGVSISQTAERTKYRGIRRIHERHLLRRERLHRVLNILGFLPIHYAENIDFEKNFGKFKFETEPKLVYRPIEKEGKKSFEFVFQKSFLEMVDEFKTNGLYDLRVPYDWTIYYLRKKALTQKIEKEELAWLLLNFNQKRGYYQLRGEEEEQEDNKTKTFETLVIKEVKDSGEEVKGNKLYDIYFVNGWKYDRQTTKPQDWENKTKEFIVTATIDKKGETKRSFKAVDSEKDWIAIKSKTEQTIANSEKTVGEFIFDSLLKNPSQKINGKLVRTIERKFYKKELQQILKTQIAFHQELKDKSLYEKCIKELYKQNEAHRSNIKNREFDYLIIDDIIFYQRPLKSKISLISDCSLEHRVFTKDGVKEIQPIKCIAKSHPLFLEFRLWQFIQNLKIYKKELPNDIDITNQYLNSEEDFVKLFEFLNDKKDLTQKQILAFYKLKEEKYRWNYVEDKPYPCNETRAIFLSKIAKIENIDASFFTQENSEALWHILYSVSDKIEIESAIRKFAKKHHLSDEFIKVFSNLAPYKNEYGAYSVKAIKKLLPLMRMGKYWNENEIHPQTKERIEKILTGEFDEKIKNRVREKSVHLEKTEDFKGLPLWLASYIVYGKHSESSDITKWNTPSDIDLFLKNEFKQHSLRNPIVEQVITETLRTVKDIWQYYGEGKENFFDEIHLELGREMKNSADKRKKITEQVSQNENTNLRIKAILEELKNEGIEVKPYSLTQQEILKIYEEGIYSNEIRKDELESIDKIRKNSKPSKTEIQRYKLWLEQGYISPYTGDVIPLSELFTTKYQIEHIFPQSRFFDDSLTNKVICESEVNGLKANQTAMEFINNHKGEKVTVSGDKVVNILMPESYKTHIEKYFAKSKQKLKNLLSEDIPESFINRQLNDSRYIAKVVKTYLSKIVREQINGELEQEVTSKNLISITGAITSQMKQDWGLNDVWNELITPRFERLNTITNSNSFGQWENKQGKKVFQTTVPNEISKGFSKKRIDHRHHALEALVIACIGRNHINYLNNLNAKDVNDITVKYELRNTICYKTKPYEKGNYKWQFHKPWETFTQDVKEKLNTTLVSFKQNTRIINKTVNKYEKYVDGKKEKVSQEGMNWAIRKPMHAETVSGKVFLKRIKDTKVSIPAVLENLEIVVNKEIKTILEKLLLQFDKKIDLTKKELKKNPVKMDDKVIDKVSVYETIEATATRKTLDTSFDEKKIEKITDTGIQKILLKHLQQEKYQNATDENGKKVPPHEAAFNEEGLEELNKNIAQLNSSKAHQPIIKVRVWEESSRFVLGNSGNKKDKYVEAAKGTNLFFAIYTDEKGNRNYKTIPLNEAIERQKQGINVAPEIDEKGNKLLFILSPNDLVYVPTDEERENPSLVNFEKMNKEQIGRVYKMVSFTGNQAFYILNSVANSIADKVEFSSLNKTEKSIEGIMIKSVCWKLKIDRLGNIKKV